MSSSWPACSFCVWSTCSRPSGRSLPGVKRIGSAQGDELDLLSAQLDLEPMTGLQSLLGGLDLADEQVGMELHLGGIAELTAQAIRCSQPRW